jgi:hypothetical protein
LIWLVGSVLPMSAFLTGAQAEIPATATIDALERYTAFYHGRRVSLASTADMSNGVWHLPIAAPRRFVILPRTGTPPTGPAEFRGQFFDVGQLDPADGRLAALGLRAPVEAVAGADWPRRGELFALVGATWQALAAPGSPATLKAPALSPETHDGRPVTVRGRFRAQNLFGDLPAWPRASEWDFVLKAGDSSVWISGLRPRGRGFDLDPRVRRGASTWLEVTGTARFVEGLVRIDARSMALSTPEPANDEAPVARESLAEPPPEMLFSVPRQGETDVDLATVVRIQFSRPMTPASFEGRVQVTAVIDATTMPLAFVPTYQANTRALEVRFPSGLPASADVTVAVSAEVTSVDGAPLAPLALRFRTRPGAAPLAAAVVPQSPRAPAR